MPSPKTLERRYLEAELATRLRTIPTLRDVGGHGVVLHPIGHRSRAARRAEDAIARRGGNALQRLAKATGVSDRAAHRLGAEDALAAYNAKKITRDDAAMLGAFDKKQRIAHRVEKMRAADAKAKRMADRTGNGEPLTQDNEANAPTAEPAAEETPT